MLDLLCFKEHILLWLPLIAQHHQLRILNKNTWIYKELDIFSINWSLYSHCRLQKGSIFIFKLFNHERIRLSVLESRALACRMRLKWSSKKYLYYRRNTLFWDSHANCFMILLSILSFQDMMLIRDCKVKLMNASIASSMKLTLVRQQVILLQSQAQKN